LRAKLALCLCGEIPWKQIEAIERQVGGPVETLRVPDCGHAQHRDQPEMVLERMTEFVAAIRAV
jgi:pimeloyl-ACP methyl ester carboxylesterase